MIILTGSDPAFCAGLDLKELGSGAGALNQSSTYTITCTGSGGDANASATVTVTTATSLGPRTTSPSYLSLTSSFYNTALPSTATVDPNSSYWQQTLYNMYSYGIYNNYNDCYVPQTVAAPYGYRTQLVNVCDDYAY